MKRTRKMFQLEVEERRMIFGRNAECFVGTLDCGVSLNGLGNFSVFEALSS